LRRLSELARARGVSIATGASLKTQLSRWENGHRSVGELHYRELLCELYGRTPAELGFVERSDLDEGAEELRARLHVARSVDMATAELFRAQIEGARRLDRRFGGVTQLAAVRAQIEDVQGLLRSGVPSPHRAALAGALVEAATLAGWEALDRVALRSAWDLHETAVVAAREARSAALLAHAKAQQSMVLVDLGEPALAVDSVAEARATGVDASPLLRAWLAAAEGEVRAAAGDREGALRSFDDADRLLPSDPRDPDLPFLFLADGHLDRWRGHVLASVGDPTAVRQLEMALARLPADFVRARSSTLVDLAVASAAAGERDAALAYSREARLVANQVASDRQVRRLRSLRLPT
jgi:tetratricopeptide (TPR) repeat protein